MIKQLKGYIFRMYPTLEQQQLMEKSFRYIYSYFLEKSQKRKEIKAYELIKELPILIKENNWLS